MKYFQILLEIHQQVGCSLCSIFLFFFRCFSSPALSDFKCSWSEWYHEVPRRSTLRRPDQLCCWSPGAVTNSSSPTCGGAAGGNPAGEERPRRGDEMSRLDMAMVSVVKLQKGSLA